MCKSAELASRQKKCRPGRDRGRDDKILSGQRRNDDVAVVGGTGNNLAR